MWRPIAPTSVTQHQLGMRMRRKMMTKTYALQVISIELINTNKHHLQACHRKERAMFTSRLDASLTFLMFINLFISLSITILFHLFYSHFNWFNKIDIVICKVDQYGDMNLKFEDDFAYCKYTVWAIHHDLRYQWAYQQCHKVNNYENKDRYKQYSRDHLQKC